MQLHPHVAICFLLEIGDLVAILADVLGDFGEQFLEIGLSVSNGIAALRRGVVADEERARMRPDFVRAWMRTLVGGTYAILDDRPLRDAQRSQVEFKTMCDRRPAQLRGFQSKHLFSAVTRQNFVVQFQCVNCDIVPRNDIDGDDVAGTHFGTTVATGQLQFGRHVVDDGQAAIGFFGIDQAMFVGNVKPELSAQRGIPLENRRLAVFGQDEFLLRVSFGGCRCDPVLVVGHVNRLRVQPTQFGGCDRLIEFQGKRKMTLLKDRHFT